MDILTKSCSPTVVITANGEVQTHQLRLSKSSINSWQWRSSITRQQYCCSESFAMKTGFPMNGFQFSFFQLQWHLHDRNMIILPVLQACVLHQPHLWQATVKPECGKIWVGRILTQYLCQENMLNWKNGTTSCTTVQNRVTCYISTYLSDCENSGKIWLIKFLNTQTHTPVFDMNHL